METSIIILLLIQAIAKARLQPAIGFWEKVGQSKPEIHGLETQVNEQRRDIEQEPEGVTYVYPWNLYIFGRWTPQYTLCSTGSGTLSDSHRTRVRQPKTRTRRIIDSDTH